MKASPGVSTRVDTPGRLCYNALIMSVEFSAPEIGAVPRIEVIGVTGIPEIQPGDRLGEIIVASAEKQGTPIEPGDILVVTQKIVSKAEARTVDLNTVEPSPFARQLAQETNRSPSLVELILRESRAIVRMDIGRGILITETRHGFVCANAGIDSSNVPGESMVCLLPEDPDRSAQGIREQVNSLLTGAGVAVIISDTFGRAWREGHVNFAIGVAGMNALKDYRGTTDAHGSILRVTVIAAADELAAAAELVTGKAINVPATIVRGYRFSPGPDGVQGLIRHPSRDLFR